MADILLKIKEEKKALKEELILLVLLEMKERKRLLRKNYDNEKAGHSEAVKTIWKIQTKNKGWKGINSEVQEYVKKCKMC